MPYVKGHRRSRKTSKVRAHRRNPPWVNTVLFFVMVIVVAAAAKAIFG